MSLTRAGGREILLQLAREAIRRSLGLADALDDRIEAAAACAELAEQHGVFVTLKIDGKLRGCIGRMRHDAPLYRSVCEVAPRSALEDPRFPPVTAEELDRARIEITTLGESRPCRDIEEIVIGRDGVELERDGARAVFLPQVAEERGWGVEQLLGQLALKAGLTEQAWREAKLRVFQGERFGEEP